MIPSTEIMEARWPILLMMETKWSHSIKCCKQGGLHVRNDTIVMNPPTKQGNHSRARLPNDVIMEGGDGTEMLSVDMF